MRAFATVSSDSIIVKTRLNPKLDERIKSLGAVYEGNSTWRIPQPNLDAIMFILNGGNKIEIDDENLNRLDNIIDFAHEREIRSERKKQLAHALEAAPIPSVLAKMKPGFEPKPYQWVACHYALVSDGRFCIFDPMGVGKSAQAVLVSLMEQYEHLPVLIISPANNTGTWSQELIRNFGIQSWVITQPLTRLVPGVRYYICSYDQLKKVKLKQDMFLIWDEANYAKELTTQRYKETKRIAQWCKHIIAMTGTPMDNRPSELYTILSIIDPYFMTWHEYGVRFCNQRRTPWGINNKGSKNEAELHTIIFNNYAIRREKKQILPQLPDKVRKVVDLGFQDLKAENVFSLYSKNAEVKSQDPVFLQWWVDTILDEPKSITFFHHKVMLNGLRKKLDELGIRYIVIDGAVESFERQRRVQQFQEDPDVLVALLSMTATRTGTTLTAASLEIFAETCFSPGILEQAEDRAHRIGQKSALTILKPRVTRFEVFLTNLLIEKMGIIARVIEGKCHDTKDDKMLMRLVSKEFGIPVGQKVA